VNAPRVVALAASDPLAAPSLMTELEHRWLVWDARVAGSRRVDIHPLVLDAAAHAEAIGVAEAACALVTRAGEEAASSPSERARYRLHADVEALAAAARAAGDLTSLARVDLLLREDGRFVACEVNADCPGGHNETLALPRLARAAGFHAGWDPTSFATALADRLVALSGGKGSPRGLVALVCATGYAEDLQVCALLERLVVERGGRAKRVPVTAPRGDGEGLAFRGERIAVLYRFYPLEYMEGQRNIEALVRATERGELASVSSFASIHAQSKLAMARAFALDPVGASRVFPETIAFADADRAALVAARDRWVVKRDLSRVGDHVFVGALETNDSFAGIVQAVAEAEAEGDVWIGQRYVPPAAVDTPWGPRCLTLGVYLLDGRFAGYLARLSKVSHCSHDALVVPVFVEGTRASQARPALSLGAPA